MTLSHLELQFDSLWEYLFPKIDLEVEQKIIPKRKFRFDYVHLESKVAIEINGGIWGYSGHSLGVGISRDYEKLNLAQHGGWIWRLAVAIPHRQSCGYVVFQLSSDMITEEWLEVIAQTIKNRHNI